MTHKRIYVEPELYSKLEQAAKTQKLTVDQYATKLLEDVVKEAGQP